MAVTLREVLTNEGYDLNTYQDALWLLSKQNEFEELVAAAEEVVEEHDV